MIRLPTPGGDDGDWGNILNDFLGVSHATNGTLNSNVVDTSQIKNAAVTNAKLDSSTQTTLAGAAQVANNLSDLANAGTARTNLGLGTAAVSDSTAFEPAGLSSGTLTTLDSRYQALLSDTGSLQQWLANTPATKGSVWAYQGVVYARLTTGTDSSFTRANWVELGADPTTIGGGELAAAILTTTQIFACTSTYTDVPGLAVAPVIPSNGRGIYVDFDVTSNSNVNAVSVQYRLYDVTANQAVPGVLKLYCATTSGTYNGFRRWRLTPAAGNQTYKIQVNISSNGNVGTYGTDYGMATGLYTTSR
jgi:hypothetical protein